MLLLFFFLVVCCLGNCHEAYTTMLGILPQIKRIEGLEVQFMHDINELVYCDRYYNMTKLRLKLDTKIKLKMSRGKSLQEASSYAIISTEFEIKTTFESAIQYVWFKSFLGF